MKYFKYWIFKGTNPADESHCVFVRAPDQDAATRLTEQVYPVSTQLKVREIAVDDLPPGREWLG